MFPSLLSTIKYALLGLVTAAEILVEEQRLQLQLFHAQIPLQDVVVLKIHPKMQITAVKFLEFSRNGSCISGANRYLPLSPGYQVTPGL